MSGGDKTEKPTPKKLEEARKKGQVAKSQDLNGAVVVLAGLFALGAFGDTMVGHVREAMMASLSQLSEPGVVSMGGIGELLSEQGRHIALACAPVAMTCMLAGILVNVVQVGGKPRPSAIKPDPKKLNPLKGFKNIYGPNALVEGGKSILKVSVVAVIVALALLPQLGEMGALVGIEPIELSTRLVDSISSLAKQAAFAYLLIGFADYGWQWHRNMKSLKMDKQEVKDEAKQQELPAEVRGAIRRRQIAASRARMMAAVPTADVVVTNPTHFAVALKYDGTKPAPEVVAKGQDLVALKIRATAADHRVPVVEDPPLARSLHASVEVGHTVPEELFEAVAQLLAYVYRIAAMKRAMRMSNALKSASKYSDLAAAGVVVLVVIMMIIPMPPLLLDFAIAANISAALAVVVATLYLPRALDFSAFPSLLLISTLFRLAINVSVTRLILLEGDAGHMVEAFGNFVVGGNVVVGLVVFLILIVIQFVVVTNGAGRVAEVGARFTLDAMPGKQMAIDADLNAGQITEEEARKRRAEISQEADFYGAMDGASKFVKGDAIAAVLITLINLVGGIVVGAVQQGMPIGEAVQHFSLLTVGDGLAAQIPALLISVATGIIVTRAASDKDLGTDLAGQVLAQRKAPMVAGAVVMALALVPGLPKIPFLIIGGGLFFIGRALKDVLAEREAEAAAIAAQEAQVAAAAGEPSSRDQALEAINIDSLELAIGFGLVPLVGGAQGGSGTLLSRVSAVRKQLAGELGTVVPTVRIHDEVGLASHEYLIKVRGVEVARGQTLAGHQLALDPGDAVGQLEGIPTTEPAFGLPALWIPDAARAEAEALGYTVVDPESVMVTHLTETIRTNVAELLTRQDVRGLLDALKERNAAVVEEVVPELLSVGEIQRVLQALLREGVSIRDLGTIVEGVGDRARLTRDPSLLAEHARQALARAIVAPHLDAEMQLRAIALDPAVEQEVSEAIAQTADGEFLAMEPSRAQALVQALASQVEHAVARGRRPVLLCSSRIRRHVRRLSEQALPQLSVCAYNEIAPGVSVETIGVVTA